LHKDKTIASKAMTCNVISLVRPISCIRLQATVQQFTVTPLAGANGVIFPANPRVVNAGSSLTFSAIPNVGFGVNQWLLDGNVVQNGGTTFQLNNIQANHTVEVTFD
jgi:hypothetical protein